MVTIYEVAERAGVAASTVSRVLNDTRLHSEKAERVRKAAKELHYVPSKTARRLRRPSSELIALMIPDIGNPFYTALARAVEDRAQERGYSVVLCNTDDDPEKENRYINVAVAEEMAGVILAPSSSEGNVSALLKRQIPVVAVDRLTDLDIDTVLIDNRAAAAAATTQLISRGYTRVGCIAGPVGELNDERARGWQQALIRAGMDFAPDLLVHGDYRVQGGELAMAELLDSGAGADSVVVMNNLMAVGALRTLASRGVDVESFGVAVIGDLPFLIHDEANIYQLELPAQDIGLMSADLLLSRIDGDQSPSRTVALRAASV